MAVAVRGGGLEAAVGGRDPAVGGREAAGVGGDAPVGGREAAVGGRWAAVAGSQAASVGRDAAGVGGDYAVAGSDRVSALWRLAAELRAEGGLLAAAVRDPDAAPAVHGYLAARGPRAAGHEAEYALLVEAIREGYLQHYGEGRVLQTDDPDLALLAGDRLYALGLARLAELGDLDAVAELADVISLCAQAHAADDADRAAAVWDAGAAAVGHGPSADHRAAKAAWRGADSAA